LFASRGAAAEVSADYTGDGVFMVAGKIISRKGLFRPRML
jgi:hypothetical protein